MVLSPLDWLLIAFYFAFSFSIAIYYYRRAGKNTTEFFLSGRNMPWWLAGTSMVATTFAADTPLAVTEFVADNGIAGNWVWWNFAFGGMLTVFFFARLWRRSGILTDVEFVELRYTGKPAAWLRGIKALYFGLLMNVLIIGWVSLAMETVIEVLFPGLTIFGQSSFNILGFELSAALMLVSLLVLVVAVYALLSGLWGVTVTDAFQFVIAITGSMLLAYYVLDDPRVGGIAGLKAKLPPETFHLLPSLGETVEGVAALALSIPAFVAFIGIQWWSSWYPGAEPGGGGYIAQRMMSAKDEKNSLFATLWFTIAHYCLRPWPWILVALASLVLYPDLANTREGFVMAMRDVLPSGLLGLLVAAFLAAFMSTISTQLNWGVSYLVNDFWRRFVKTDREERYYVVMSRLFTFLVAILSIFVTAQLESIKEGWELVLTASAGLGLVLILRWYWWRINAWSELTATIVPILMVILSLVGVPIPGLDAPFPINLFSVVAITTVIWVMVTFATRPTDTATLDAFYRLVRPPGPGWKPVGTRHADVMPDTDLRTLALNWAAGVVLVYSTLFGTGHLLLGRTGLGLVCIALAAACGGFLYWDLSRREMATTATAD
ncbi:MAG: Na+:solute symporter [Bacteroidetes bacterium]|nr:Na+:solute symporter [Bacteroidota bacterium]